ncbi:UNVERIFIED_CONTAM: hypothetical protein PYX00_001507 [Menopon gallinae]|uniref:FLYWCH-type domain-containing protein n=1 Tax=Menopon gallinae TaxID=328185 RepID=A0AAW2IEC2_9NEOP
MIQTKRGKDMLLYDGYTFIQNRMCKDGMRWQCSFPKCKAFCRMSSAGWLTPHKTNHEHPKPSEEEIRKRILTMELKARAQSSGATPGEIIRNALPAEEYQTTDKRACYTRCIQRFRKSLQKKNSKPPDDIWLSSNNPQNNAQKESGSLAEERACSVSKSDGLKEESRWSHQEATSVADHEETQTVLKQKSDLNSKLGPYGI